MGSKRVLITGASGYLGGVLVKLCKAAGYTVFPVSSADADITDPAALKSAFERILGYEKSEPIDFVLHLAGADAGTCGANPERAMAVNAQGAKNTLEAAAAFGAKRFFLFSTFHVYGENGVGTITEETKPLPKHPYGESKLAGELLCKEEAKKLGVSLVIFRVSNGVGEPASKEMKQWSLVMLDLCREAQEKGSLTLKGSGLQLRDFVSIKDIFSAVELLSSLPDSALADLDDPVFNLGSSESISIRDLAKLIAKEFKQLYGKELVLNIPEPSGDSAGASAQSEQKLLYRTDKLRALGFTPKTNLQLEANEILKFCEVFR